MSETESLDTRLMSRAIELARRGLWTTDPNPRVGCVIADGGRVVAEGWHERAGEPHAEAVALAAAGPRARGGTAYVTLEPCSHQGRTPPCADALIAAGVARVVCSMRDPNPRVDGGGIARLRAAGVAVDCGLLQEEARALNPGFVSRMERGRPWVTLKLAASLDGGTALAGGESRWITGEAARADVQALRARSSALLTGIGTVLKDDPRLDLRLAGTTRQPLRVVLDSNLRTPPGARIVAPPGRLLILCAHADAERAAALRAAGADIEVIPSAADGVDLAGALTVLAAREVNELLVECGARLAGSLIAADRIDEMILYQAPVLLGRGARPLAEIAAPATLAGRREFELIESLRVGADLRLRLRPRH